MPKVYPTIPRGLVSALNVIPHLANRQSGGKNAEPSSLHSHAQIPQKVSRGNLWQHFPLLSSPLLASGASQLQSSFSICQIISIINRYNMRQTPANTGLKCWMNIFLCFQRKAFKITLWCINRLIERWENHHPSCFIWSFTILSSNKAGLKMWLNWFLSGLDSDQLDIGHFSKWAE